MSKAGYIPGLDGLRALAVLAVLVFHANATWLPGGFIGVEVFFAISGFIITRGLVAEWQATGAVDLKSFWQRRARRLLPAVFLLLAVVLPAVAAFDNASLASLRRDVLASLLYVTNWHLVFSEQSYFDSWARPSFLKHLWSLAVEEQFYLLWPAFFALVLVRLNRWLAVGLVTALALASALHMARLYEPGMDASRLYYGTDTRLGGLLLGAAVAMLPWRLAPAGLVGRGVMEAAGLAALAGLIALSWLLGEDSAILYRGGFLAVSLLTVGLIASIRRPESLLGRALGAGPLRWIGVRSYGIYLWHWPVFLLGWPETPGPVQALAQIAAAVGIAALSYRLVEEPVRRGALGEAWRSIARNAGTGPRRVAFASLAVVALAPVSIGGAAMLSSPAAPASSLEQSSRIEVSLLSTGFESVLLPELQVAAPAPTSATEAPAAELQPAVPLPHRQDCAAIRGSDYRSEAEREWFQANCVVVPAPAPARTTTSASTAASSPRTAPVAGRVTAIGDSVMLGAASALAAAIPGIQVDAVVGRQAAAAVSVMRDRAAAGTLGEVVVIHIGNNGTFSASQLDEMMRIAGPSRTVVFVNLKLPRSWEGPNNRVLADGIARHANARLVDWHGASSGNGAYFAADQVHLTGQGAWAYAQLVVVALY